MSVGPLASANVIVTATPRTRVMWCALIAQCWHIADKSVGLAQGLSGMARGEPVPLSAKRIDSPSTVAVCGRISVLTFSTCIQGVCSSGDELLPAVDVVRRAGECRVAHNVDSERGDVGGADDAADRERRPQLIPALLEPVSEQ